MAIFNLYAHYHHRIEATQVVSYQVVDSVTAERPEEIKVLEKKKPTLANLKKSQGAKTSAVEKFMEKSKARKKPDNKPVLRINFDEELAKRGGLRR